MVDQTDRLRGSQLNQSIPLFYEETLNASLRRNELTTLDNSDDMDLPKNKIFRDTQVDKEEADIMMNCQSLASIVNNPKKESMFKKVKTMLRHQIQGGPSPYYKAMGEKDVEESTIIPIVKAAKDFKTYKKKLEHACVSSYQDNHSKSN